MPSPSRPPGRILLLLGALATVVALAACGRHTETLRWEVMATQGSAVTIRAAHGDCDDGPHAHVRETAGTVTITVTTRDHGDSCDSALRMTAVVVHLKQPLGDRTLTGCAAGVSDCATYSATG
jgi:hypothetical protein